MITTEELREMASSTHPLHGDLARVCNAWLAEREAKPTPTDHAELRGLADSWPKPVRRFGDWSRGCREGQEECSSELDRLLTPALEELDRLRAELAEMTRRMINLAERNAAVAQMMEALEEARHYVAVYGNGGRPNELLDQMRAALDAAKGGKS